MHALEEPSTIGGTHAPPRHIHLPAPRVDPEREARRAQYFRNFGPAQGILIAALMGLGIYGLVYLLARMIMFLAKEAREVSGALVNYDEGRRRIQLARSHDEIADLRDKAQALVQYARQAKDSELLGWVSEIKVRAERRAGELIIEEQQNGKLTHGGDHKSRSQRTTLKSQDITKTDSSRWQKMAGIDEERFEKAIASAKDQLGEVTSAFMLREAATKTGPKKAGKLRKVAPIPVGERADRDGQLARFYVVVSGCQAIIRLGLTPRAWLADAPPELRHVISSAVGPANKWLSTLLRISK